jgi:VWFA-related protein
MTPSRLVITVAAGLVLAVIGVEPAAQEVSVPRSAQPLTSAATAILVDVVVRDKNGRPITNLSADDFKLAEDGVPHKVESFTRVTRGGGIGVAVAWRSPRPTTVVSSSNRLELPPVDAPQEDGATAIVFDQLSSESLGLAQKATLGYVPMSGDSPVRIGVFATDQGVRVLQRYTTDRSLVRQAVTRAIPSGLAAEEQKLERADELLARRRDLLEDPETPVAGGTGTNPASMARSAAQIGQRESEVKLIQTELNMLRSFEHVDRERRGFDAAVGLLAVVQSLSLFPGRKTIVFFSEGLPASPALSARLDYIIDRANRANVTAYVVDANGLGAKSTSTNIRKEMETYADDRFRQLASGSDRAEQPLTTEFERVEDTLRLDSRTGLARLANDTGGFLFEQSNDFSSAFRRIDEDNQFHYLLTYSPTNTVFDGKFRSIQVKVNRSGAHVFARKGYRAVRTPGVTDAGSESPALALLARKPLPNAFEVRAASFSFPDPARPGLTPVLVQVGTSGLQFDVDRQRSAYLAQAAILVRVRDGQGRDVQTLSQQYLLTGEAKDMAAAKQGDILFYRELDLPPGVYTVESIVFDEVARDGSARVATLVVPPATPSAIGMSSLVLVKRVEDAGESPRANPDGPRPLYVGNTLIYPNLGEAIRKSAASELPFFFTLYGSTAAVAVHAQILHNGRALAEAPVPVPQTTGPRVQHVGRLHIGALPAGTYELRMLVQDGQQVLSRTAFFTLIE